MKNQTNNYRMSGEQTAAQFAIMYGSIGLLIMTWMLHPREEGFSMVMEMTDRIFFSILYAFFLFVSIYNIRKRIQR
jgi:hypothetical protein